VRPFNDLGCAICVLLLHRVAYVAELAVLEDQKAVSASDACEPGSCAVGGTVVPVVDEVIVGFEYDDLGPYCVCEVEELVGG